MNRPLRQVAQLFLPLTLLVSAMAFAMLELHALEPLARTGFGLDTLLRAGAKANERIEAGELFTLVSAGFLHVNAIHFSIDILGVIACGALFWRTAPRQDWCRAFVLLGLALTTSTAGFLASYLIGNGPSCGASAMAFGLLGGAAGSVWTIHHDQATTRWGRAFPAIVLTLIGFGLLAALLPTPGVDHAAHLGGYLSGLMFGAATNHHTGRLALALTTSGIIALALATL